MNGKSQQADELQIRQLKWVCETLHVRLFSVQETRAERPFTSPREASAVLFERLESLWDLVKRNKGHGEEAEVAAFDLARDACHYVLELILPIGVTESSLHFFQKPRKPESDGSKS